MGLVTQETAFNSTYSTKYKDITFNNLLDFAWSYGLIDDDMSKNISDSYKKAITDRIMSNYEYDREDDIGLIIRNKTSRYIGIINDYIQSLNNPYQTINTILSNDPRVLIETAETSYNEKEKICSTKLAALEEKSSLLLKYSHEYCYLIAYLRDRLNGVRGSQLVYPTLDGTGIVNLVSLTDLERVIDKLSIESDILNKFSKNELLKLVTSINAVTMTMNICEMALNNYVFNHAYGINSILVSDNMVNIIINGVKNGFFDSNDVIDAVDNGEVLFTEEEKEYIKGNYLPHYEDEILNRKHIDQYIIKR